MAIASIRDSRLRRLWERDDDRRVPPECVERLVDILAALADATHRADLAALPGIHRLTGNLAGYYAVRVDRQQRVIFRWTARRSTSSSWTIIRAV